MLSFVCVSVLICADPDCTRHCQVRRAHALQTYVRATLSLPAWGWHARQALPHQSGHTQSQCRGARRRPSLFACHCVICANRVEPPTSMSTPTCVDMCTDVPSTSTTSSSVSVAALQVVSQRKVRLWCHACLEASLLHSPLAAQQQVVHTARVAHALSRLAKATRRTAGACWSSCRHSSPVCGATGGLSSTLVVCGEATPTPCTRRTLELYLGPLHASNLHACICPKTHAHTH